LLRAGIQIDRGNELAVSRMLQRGPAYRARSWAWPSDEQTGGSGTGGGDLAAAAAGVLSSPPAGKTPPVILDANNNVRSGGSRWEGVETPRQNEVPDAAAGIVEVRESPPDAREDVGLAASPLVG
ncbi:unnamed protein product, partial [Laminaria digitata]